ncbi:hypothetical protein [Streptomyces sp. XD-27]|uniref:divisome protein SepX/GlpR n=1 Tax=Streptomyces sp. XD-27 TaxID=3062779 RepID=UPI0026F41C66|nr:hypothetical protein [Streptomyces sp. XD-27]WKX72206.1 hypothetical protein Q3Y56_21945 [Streptomyces sp. XD-27]
MSSSGLIYAVIVGAWAAYLVPMWLRRQDELNEARPTERFSTAIRLLSGRAAMERRYAKDLEARDAEVPQTGAHAADVAGVADPDAETDLVDVRAFVDPAAGLEPAGEADRDQEPDPASDLAPTRAASRPPGPSMLERTRRAKVLARRRRTTVVLFLAFTVGAVVAAVGGLAFLWAPGIPAVLLSAYIVHLRAQERRRFTFTMDQRRAELAAQRLRERRTRPRASAGSGDTDPSGRGLGAAGGELPDYPTQGGLEHRDPVTGGGARPDHTAGGAAGTERGAGGSRPVGGAGAHRDHGGASAHRDHGGAGGHRDYGVAGVHRDHGGAGAHPDRAGAALRSDRAGTGVGSDRGGSGVRPDRSGIRPDRAPRAERHAPDRDPAAAAGPGPEQAVSAHTADRRALVEQTDHAEWVDQQRERERGPAAGESWEPVPVPLPTYVTAPVAPRASGSVDLDAPDAWSSARSSAAGPTADPEAPQDPTLAPPTPPRRTRDRGRTPLFDQYADDGRPRAANE